MYGSPVQSEKPVQIDSAESEQAMKTNLRINVSLMVLGTALFSAGTVTAAPQTCWQPVLLAGNTAVRIHSADQSPVSAQFISAVGASVQSTDSQLVSAGIKAGAPVRLSSGSGQILLPETPLALNPVGTPGRYAFPESTSPLHSQRLTAEPGVLLKAPVPITGGLLPADTPAQIIAPQGFIHARLNAPEALVPLPQSANRARLSTGSMPITRGGRTLEVNLYVPEASAEKLRAEVFQSCFTDSASGASDRAALSLRSTRADIVSVTDGQVTLSVPVPEALNPDILYNFAQLRILAPSLGVLSEIQTVIVGDPKTAAFLSILVVLFVLYTIACVLERNSETTRNAQKKYRLLVFAMGVNGENYSLSLIQILMWTILVLIGMVYVFLMSGDLMNITWQVLVLLGLTGTGSISARWISMHVGASGTGRSSGFRGMLMTDGQPDLLRLQMFVFTITVWLYVAVQVFYEQKFPELSPNTLLLMGISNGVYVGAKWVGASASRQRQLNAEIDEFQARLDALVSPGTGKIKPENAEEHASLLRQINAARKQLEQLKGTSTAAAAFTPA